MTGLLFLLQFLTNLLKFPKKAVGNDSPKNREKIHQRREDVEQNRRRIIAVAEFNGQVQD